MSDTVIYCNTLRHTATHCNTLQQGERDAEHAVPMVLPSIWEQRMDE